MNIISEICNTVINIFFPRRCPVCDRPVKPFGALICAGCEGKIRYIAPPYCMKCGKSVSGDREYCDDCRRTEHVFDRGFSVFEYRSVADSLYRFKYSGRKEYAAYYGERVAALLGDTLKELRPQAIIPVPIHASRRRKRGYNQAEAIAKEVSKRLGIPVEKEFVIRTRKTVPMKELGVAERQNNLKKAFKIHRNDVKLITIVILDDIYTTGSTVDELASVLRAAGVRNIYVVSLSIGKGV